MSSAIAPKATLAINSRSFPRHRLPVRHLTLFSVADFTRYGKSPKVVVWTNLLSLTLSVDTQW
jgi:hypothetical protein